MQPGPLLRVMPARVACREAEAKTGGQAVCKGVLPDGFIALRGVRKTVLPEDVESTMLFSAMQP